MRPIFGELSKISDLSQAKMNS